MVTRALFDVVKVDFAPADRTANELLAVIPVYTGDIILGAYHIPVVLSSTSNTVSLGHTGDVARFTASYDTSGGTVNTPIDGQTAAMPRTILADQNLNVDYVAVGGGGTTVPRVRFVVTILRAPRF